MVNLDKVIASVDDGAQLVLQSMLVAC